MRKLNEAAKIMGEKVEDLIQEVKCDMALVVFSHDGALAACCAGKKAKIKEGSVIFLKTSIKRLQQIVDGHERGELDISEASDDGFIHYVYSVKEDAFQSLDEWEAEQNGEKGFAS